MAVTLRIRVRDVYGNPLPDRGDLEIWKHSTGGLVGGRRDKLLSPTFTFAAEEGELYRIMAFPSRYRPVGRFTRAPESGTQRVDLICPVDPARVTAPQFPAWPNLPADLKLVLGASTVEGFAQSGEQLYNALDSLQRAGLLNLFAKLSAVILPSGRTTWSYVRSLYRIRGDRVFAIVDTDFRDAIKNAVLASQFRVVDGSLHTPPPGFSPAGSFKTFDPFGNLQLTFFASLASPIAFRVDADVDDAGGIAHFFDVVGHAISGAGTHPFDIHQILVGTQHLDPRYTLRA